MYAYMDELKEINHKSKLVYLKHGIRPFLTDDICSKRNDNIPGFQIERLYPRILEEK